MYLHFFSKYKNTPITLLLQFRCNKVELICYGSRFFDGIARHNELSGYIFGNIVFELNGYRLNIQDLAVHKTASQSTGGI